MKTFKETVVAVAKDMVKSDSSSKVLFNDTLALLKGADVKDVKSSIKGLVDDATDALGTDYASNFKNRIVKTIRLAGKWYDKKLFTKHEELFMYNIEGGLKLLDALEELSNLENTEVTPEDIKKVKNKLNRVKFVDKISYNDMFETKVKEIMKEYNLSDVDGKVKRLEDSIEKLWSLMSVEQKEAFKAKIAQM